MKTTIKTLVLIAAISTFLASIMKKVCIYYSALMDGMGVIDSFAEMKMFSNVINIVTFIIVALIVYFLKIEAKEEIRERKSFPEQLKLFVQTSQLTIISTLISITIIVTALYLGLELQTISFMVLVKLFLFVWPYYCYTNSIITVQICLIVFVYKLYFIIIEENKD